MTREGEPVPPDAGGFLVVESPGRRCCGPSTETTSGQAALLGADPRHVFHRRRRAAGRGRLFLGDGPRRRRINVAGHRLSTMEVESALVAHPQVAEAAVVARPDEIKGQGIAAFVTLEMGTQASEDLKRS